MELVITPNATVRAIYGEAIALHSLGRLEIRRGSHVEPDALGRWKCDLSPVDGPLLGPFTQRSEALAAEQKWLTAHWLVSA
ncbi:MAG: hypothetical protein ABFD16_28565 [Thermoguttaceae bacterium]|jgi:hypothetical protein